MVQITCGLEIETEVNSKKLLVDRAPYHSSEDDTVTFGKAFKVETDGSLAISKWSDGGYTAEFISTKFNIDNYKKIIDNFKEEVIKRSKESDLSQVLNFNSTTGCHIHISIKTEKGTRLPLKMLNASQLIKFNSSLLEKVKKELPEVYPSFSRGFYRSYARKRININDRYCSWNFTISDISRLEFRSFNLRGVKTWEQFDTMLKIVFNALKKMCDTTLTKGFEFKSTLSNKQFSSMVLRSNNSLRPIEKVIAIVE